MNRLYYLAKPTYGGWISFTAHLSKMLDIPIHKITKTTEKKARVFGYGAQYQNLSPDDAIHIANNEHILITAIDKTKHNLLEMFPHGTYLVIHDPTEIKSNKGALMKNIDRFNIITIRKTVHDLLSSLGIKNTFLYHPYLSTNTDRSNESKSGAVSISRIDYDKNTDIILKANEFLLNPIHIYGSKNDRYVYHKLRDLDPMKETIPLSHYKGCFPKTLDALSKILTPAKFVVDLSTIHKDGGGTQYTFLEAIDHNCALILHKKWITSDSIFKPGYNCYAVSDETELQNILNDDPDTRHIITNAKKLLKNHDNHHQWSSIDFN